MEWRLQGRGLAYESGSAVRKVVPTVDHLTLVMKNAFVGSKSLLQIDWKL
jgi:hypothetical protein